MQRIKDLHQLQHFPTTLKLLTMCMRPDFLDTLLKEPNGFSKYVKSLINYSIIRELLPQYGRKDLVTDIFFERRIKEKLNTRFGYYFWECCLWYFVVFNLFAVLNPYNL